jgi:hypothetical protein
MCQSEAPELPIRASTRTPRLGLDRHRIRRLLPTSRPFDRSSPSAIVAAARPSAARQKFPLTTTDGSLKPALRRYGLPDRSYSKRGGRLVGGLCRK